MVLYSVKTRCCIRCILLHVLFGSIKADVSTTLATPTNVCENGQFFCAQDQTCILNTFKCDYQVDCKDGTDERNCGSCDFSKDTCGYASYGDSKFKLTKPDPESWHVPSTDHSTNRSTGYFMMINEKNRIDSSKPTILESGSLSITSPQCVLQFYYYYASKDENTIEVKVVQPYEPYSNLVESLLWKKELQSSEKWQKATVAIGHRPNGWSLIISAEQRYVSIDDIKFLNCTYPRPSATCKPGMEKCNDGSCIFSSQLCDFSKDCLDGSDENPDICDRNFKERCSFEESYECNWHQDETDDFEWRNIRKSTLANFPRTDHTSGTSEGRYLAIDASKHEENKSAKLLSLEFKEGIKGKCHMKLFYYIKGAGHSLRIWQQTLHNSTLKKELGSDSAVPNLNTWKSAIVKFAGEDFQVVLEARIGRDMHGVIAIDDISFTPECDAALPPEQIDCKEDEFSCGNGQCISCIQDYCRCNFIAECLNSADEAGCHSSCNFEHADTCGWKNQEENDLKWVLHRGYTSSSLTGPPFDHTKKTKEGYYIYVKAERKPTSYDDEHKFPIARLSSPVYARGAHDCKFSLWHNMYHEKVVENNDAILKVVYRCTYGKKKRFTTLLSETKTTGIGWKKATVQLPRCPKQFSIILEALHYWKTKTDIAVDDIKFECAEKPPVPCNNETEFQCYVTKQCVPIESLCDCVSDCCDDSDESEKLCADYSRLDFESGFINGWKPLMNYDFQFTLQHGSTQSLGTGPEQDHTYEEEHGTYIYTEATSMPEDATAAIGGPTISGNKNSSKCMLRFWYNMFGGGMGTLKVYIAFAYGEPGREVWMLSGNQGKGWKKANVQLSSDRDFQVIFKAWIGSNYQSDIAIDDISLTPGCELNGKSLPGTPTPAPKSECTPNFHCSDGKCINPSKLCDFQIDCLHGSDESESQCGYPEGFEHGMGPWLNREKNSVFIRNRKTKLAPRRGPSVDARGNRTGHYIYLSGNSEEAILESPTYKFSYANCKLIFSSYMHGGSTMIKVVLINSFKEMTELFAVWGDTGKGWIQNDITIGRQHQPFRIQFIAKDGNGGADIAIDEINFLNCSHPPQCTKANDKSFKCANNYCISNSKKCNLVDDCGDNSDENLNKSCIGYTFCNFDDLFCNFTNDNNSDFTWTRNNGPTMSMNTGPSHDHTLRTSKGYYMYIETSQRTEGERARLKTFPLNSLYAKNKCALTFYYHMYGSSLGTLRINVLIGKNKTRYLRRVFNGPSKFLWRKAVVDLSNISGEFQVEFEGVVGKDYQGDIAIDDIIFPPDCRAFYSTQFPTQVRNESTIPICIPTGPACNNRSGGLCENFQQDDPSCNNPSGSKHGSEVLKIALLSGLLVLAVGIVIIVIIIIMTRKKKVEKFHIYSIFDDSLGNQEMKTTINPDLKTISKIGAVSNRAYDNDVSDGSNGLKGCHEYKAKPLSRSSSCPHPLYQEITPITQACPNEMNEI